MALKPTTQLDEILAKLTLLTESVVKQSAEITELKNEQQRQISEMRTLGATTFVEKVFQSSTPITQSTPNPTDGSPTAKNNNDRNIDNVSTISTSPCKIKPQPFDSNAAHWRDYRIQFEIVAEANNWDNSQKAQILASMLRGEAVSILSNLSANDRRDYNKLTSALELRFLSQQAYITHATFRSRRQRYKEDLCAFGCDIQRLSRLVFSDCPPEAQERISMMQFLDGISDRFIQDAVRLTNPTTLGDALNKAITIEAAHISTQTSHLARATAHEDGRHHQSSFSRIDKVNNTSEQSSKSQSTAPENFQKSASRGGR